MTNKPFKFYHRVTPELIYTLHPDESITWDEGDGPESCGGYSEQIVEAYIKKGIWVIVEEDK
jgi:hypothetical protein